MRKRAGVIIRSNDEILLIKRIKNEKQYWVVPGGGIDEGENSLEAACRELQEELELVAKQEQLQPFCEIKSEEKDETYYQIEIEKREFVIHGEEEERSNEKNVYIPTWVAVEKILAMDLKPDEIKEKILEEVPVEIRTLVKGKICELDDVGRSSSTVIAFDNMVLKVEPHTQRIDESIETMRWMAERLPVPKVLYYEVMNGKSYLLMSRIEGKMSCDPYYMERPDELVELLAEGLKMLWSVDITGCRQVWSLEGDWEKVRDTLKRTWKTGELIEAPDGKVLESPEQVMVWLEENKPEVELALSHGDYCLPNVFLKDGKVSGFIDLGTSGVADKYLDIADCYWSLKYNFNGYFGGKVYEDFDPDILFEKLGKEIDKKKVLYYRFMFDLADK